MLWLIGITVAQEVPMSVPLELVPDGCNQMTLRELSPGEYEVVTQGGDPYAFTKPLAVDYDHGQVCVLACEIFCPPGLDSFQVFYGPPRESHSATLKGLPKSEAWAKVAVPLEQNWDRAYRTFRLDFGRRDGITLQIRNIHLRALNREERKQAEEREAKAKQDEQLAQRWQTYLKTEFPGRIESVTVNRDVVKIVGRVDRPAALRGVPMHLTLGQFDQAAVVSMLEPGPFTAAVPRFLPNGQDHAYYRWVLTDAKDGNVLLSHARYATDVSGMAPDNPPPKQTPKTIKGLGGVGFMPGYMQDLVDLGVNNITANISLTNIFAPEAGGDTYEHVFEGRTFHVRKGVMEGHDRLMTFAYDHGIVVSAILLIPRGGSPELRRIWMHPDTCEPGIYTMANVASAEGVLYYAAAIDVLASRYCRADAKYGRIANWIIHNEVDAGWVWTNAGEKRLETYLDLYQRSMRIAQLTVRQHDPHGRAFISLTHHWTQTGPRFYKPKEMLLLLRDMCRREGDFEWGVAYHPYPQNLRDPRTWNDKTVNDTFDTPKITFKNLQVIDRWMQQPDFLFDGKPRGLLFSEQGPNSPDLSEKSQIEQAAAMVYFWRKVRNLKTLEAFQNHRWIDHAKEGGLLLGLRTFQPGTITTPGDRKKIWYVFQALDTPQEEEVTAFAAKVIGVKSLDEIR
jgi:hypothetical protein